METTVKYSQMLAIGKVDGLFLGDTFAWDSPPIKAAARSTVEVAGASCGRIILKNL